MTADARESAPSIEPIFKDVWVPLARERAFVLFTEEVAGWWPLASHSVSGKRAVECRFEPRAGGRMVEVVADGTQHLWGTVLEWEPPAGLVMSWHPGRTPDTAQQLSITFTPEGTGTRLRLVHTGWQKLAGIAPRERENYDSGWDYVLGLYVGRAASA